MVIAGKDGGVVIVTGGLVIVTGGGGMWHGKQEGQEENLLQDNTDVIG